MFVVSDLHLGGRPADPAANDWGFQMCSPEGQRRLAAWVAWCTGQITDDRCVEIVLAGDIVDFLAEEPFSAFTSDDTSATKKLETILARTTVIWSNLAAFVAAGGKLTLMLGNHDVELSLPGPRRLLLDSLGRGSAPRFLVDFIDDNRARTEGPVIVEHGNRYDPWNAVPHNKLRETRSALSRGDTAGAPKELDMPGSRLVTEVMNAVKKQHRFIDLLKPEEKGALPILAALDPTTLPKLKKLARLAAGASLRHRSHYDSKTGAPTGRDEIAAAGGWRKKTEDPLVALAAELARERGYEEPAPSQIGAIEDLRGGVVARLSDWTESQLFRALRAFADSHHLKFQIDHEDELYAKPAEALGKRYSVVVFGHTHLAKRVHMKAGSLYLNTGTWADLMRLPPSILDDRDDADAKAELRIFAHDLRENALEQHIRQLPTFAQIDFGSGSSADADVFLFQKDGGGARALPSGSLWALWDEYGR